MKKTSMQLLLLGCLLNFTPAFAHEGKSDQADAEPVQQGHKMQGSTVMKPEQKPWGLAGDAEHAQRIITLTMTDNMRFSPDTVTVNEGETIRFKVGNTGGVLHEMVIGTPEALAEHAELMKKFPGMEHDEAYMAHVPAGETGEVIWTFNRSGSFAFACLIPGHYEAGMRGTILVQARK